MRTIPHARRGLWTAGLCLLAHGAAAQDAARGAMLYLRAPGDARSCVACHGPDPGANPNNILRAANQPDALTKAVNTVSPMGFLRSVLGDADRADIAAFLGSVAGQSAGTGLQLWPVTLEFGTVTAGQAAAPQHLRLRNDGLQPAAPAAIEVQGDGFTLTHDCPPRLAPAASCDLEVRARPAALGWSRAAVRVDAGAAAPLLAGGSVQAVAEPTSSLRWVQEAARVQRFDATALTRSFLLHNDGPMPATLGSTTIVGPRSAQFRVVERCPGVSVLQAGTECPVAVAYAPGVAPAEALLQVRADAGNPTPLRLSGDALAEMPPRPVEDVTAGGGCATRGPGGGADPMLGLLAVGAALLAWRRRRAP